MIYVDVRIVEREVLREVESVGGRSSPIAPETIMHHSECSRGVFVIVCETFRIEEFHDSGTRCRTHP